MRARSHLAFAIVLALAGCTGTGGGLSSFGKPEPAVPVGSVDQQQEQQVPDADAIAAEQRNLISTGQSQATVVTSGARIRFAPIVGATPQAAVPLSRELAMRATQSGIQLTGNEDGNTTHVMKGYFSAISESGQTTVIYVWDVLDPAGNRLHRIQGQKKSAGGNGDAWSSVSDATMEAIADATIQSLTQWLQTQKRG